MKEKEENYIPRHRDIFMLILMLTAIALAIKTIWINSTISIWKFIELYLLITFANVFTGAIVKGIRTIMEKG